MHTCTQADDWRTYWPTQAKVTADHDFSSCPTMPSTKEEFEPQNFTDPQAMRPKRKIPSVAPTASQNFVLLALTPKPLGGRLAAKGEPFEAVGVLVEAKAQIPWHRDQRLLFLGGNAGCSSSNLLRALLLNPFFRLCRLCLG